MVNSISLLDMPDDVMRKILVECNIVSILCLQKTCHNLRNFISHVPLDSKISKIYIKLKPDFMTIDFEGKNFSKSIYYFEKERKVERNDSELVTPFSRNVDVEQIFLKDLKTILSYQQSILTSLKIDFLDTVDFLTEFREIFKSKSPLKIKRLQMKVTKPDEVLSILPYLDSNYLDKMRILNRQENDLKLLEMEEIVQLDQWKELKEVDISGFFLESAFRHFENFENVKIGLNTVTVGHVLVLKETLFDSKTLKYFQLRFSKLENREELDNALARMFGNRQAFFVCPDRKHVLTINFHSNYLFFIKDERVGR